MRKRGRLSSAFFPPGRAKRVEQALVLGCQAALFFQPGKDRQGFAQRFGRIRRLEGGEIGAAHGQIDLPRGVGGVPRVTTWDTIQNVGLGVFLTAMGLLSAVVFVNDTRKKRQIITIREDGFEETRCGIGFVRWDDVEKVQPFDMYNVLAVDITVKRFYYESHVQLRRHLVDLVAAYNFGRRLKTLKGLTPYEFICKQRTSQPQRFTFNPLQQMPGPNI